MLCHLLTTDNNAVCQPASYPWTSFMLSVAYAFNISFFFLAIGRALSVLEGDNEVVHCNCSVSFRKTLIPKKESSGRNIYISDKLSINYYYWLFPIRDTGERILSLIALGLDLDAEFFHKIGALDCPSTFLRLLHYPGYSTPFFFYINREESKFIVIFLKWRTPFLIFFFVILLKWSSTSLRISHAPVDNYNSETTQMEIQVFFFS